MQKALPEVVQEYKAALGTPLEPTLTTGEGTLRLTRVQAAGRAEEAADAWAEERRLGPGDRLTGDGA